MCYKKQEKDLLRKIEDEGIERLVRHLRFKLENGELETVELDGDKYNKTRAVTFVTLYDGKYHGNSEQLKKDFFNIESDKDIEEFNEKYKDNKDVVGTGYAICDRRDNFNKTLGRLIATGRAYKK